MVEGRLRYVKRVVDRYGKTRHYFRVNQRTYPLHGAVGSSEFLRSYNALLARHYSGRLKPSRRRSPQRPERPVRALPGPGSIEWVIIEYLKSRQFADFASATRKTYRSALDHMRLNIGKQILVRLDTEDVDLYCAQIARRGSACADLHLRLLSSLWKFSKGLPECRRKGRSNPTYDAEKRYTVRLPHEPWPLSVQRRFLEAASPSVRLAFHLLLFTGQRRSDVVQMKWSDFDGEKIRVTQGKTGELVSIHVHKKLRELLHTTPRVHERILTTKQLPTGVGSYQSGSEYTEV
jgi:integrase